jgi:hypothetical protein
VPPPGEEGTISFTGREGQASCAAAGTAMSASAHAAARTNAVVFMGCGSL